MIKKLKNHRLAYVIEDDYGVEVSHLLPGAYEVCWRCRGTGSHVNPSIDSNGITESEWWGEYWCDDSREAYMTGRYDVTCHECKGEKVNLEIDWDELKERNPVLAKQIYDDQNEQAEFEHICEMERRMGC